MEDRFIVKGIDMTSIVEVMTSCNIPTLAKVLDEAIFCYVYDKIENGSGPSDSDNISNLRFLRDGLQNVKDIIK